MTNERIRELAKHILTNPYLKDLGPENPPQWMEKMRDFTFLTKELCELVLSEYKGDDDE
jgi:hypothetical protein